jgi:hypothetical protein
LAALSEQDRARGCPHALFGRALLCYNTGKALPTGAAKELLPAQTASFEFHPSFNRDGSQIVHVLWDDRELSTIQIVKINLQTGVTGEVRPHAN